MPSHPIDHATAAIVGLVLVLAGCVSDGAMLAPMTPAEQWTVPEALVERTDSELVRADADAPEIDTAHRYDLPALIDLAQRLDPQTRLAWEQAREAASAVDTTRAAYFPQVGAGLVIGAGTSAITYDLPGVGNATVDNAAAAVVPALFAEWLLFDFGEREAAVKLARNLALSQNLAFNLAHQQTVLDVTKGYHALASARAQAKAAAKALANSRRILDAAQARLDRGVGNVVEVAQAEQALARARLADVRAEGTERGTHAALMAAVGLSPQRRLKVATRLAPLPNGVDARLDAMVRRALRHRPDVLQAVVNLDARRAARQGTEAAFRPKVGVVASVARNEGRLSIDGNGFNLPATNTTALLTVEFPIFDGGLRASRKQVAEAGVAAARAELSSVRNAAVAEIVTAYEALRTALSAWRGANALVTASRKTAAATFAAYREGVGSLPEALAAQNGLLDAEQLRAQARADAQVSAAALAFATGSLR